MKKTMAKLFILLIFTLSSAALSKPEEKKDRVYDRELSDQEHYENQEHNPQYDHEAFLGEEAKTFDQLPPEESIRRLGIIVDKIDNNNDGFVTEEELKDWIKYTQKRYIRDDTERHWKQHTADGRTEVSWEDYKNVIYGFLEHMDPAEAQKDDAGISYHNMMKRDRRRWAEADSNHDDKLTKEEFAAFLHPEETEHMRDIVVLETMEDIDKDKDGKISMKEYIGDMYQGEENDLEPEWVQNEKLQFSTYRDKDGNGYMDEEEVKNWILPPDFDHAEAEARHLLYEADSDADQKLTKQEILDKYDVFVGSQATDFGEALSRHDEF